MKRDTGDRQGSAGIFGCRGSFFVCIIMDANGWEEKVRRRFQKELVYGYIVAEHKLKENL